MLLRFRLKYNFTQETLTMNIITGLAKSKEFTILDKLFKYEISSSFFFVKDKDGVSGFDVVLQYMTKYDFYRKESLLRMMKTHFSNVNLYVFALESPLLKKINEGNTQFYSILKNVFRFLHKVNGTAVIDGSLLINKLHFAFVSYPKASRSLVQYLLRQKIITDIREDDVISYFCCTRQLTRLTLEQLGTDINDEDYVNFYQIMFSKCLYGLHKDFYAMYDLINEYYFLFSVSGEEFTKSTKYLCDTLLELSKYDDQNFLNDTNKDVLQSCIYLLTIGECELPFEVILCPELCIYLILSDFNEIIVGNIFAKMKLLTHLSKYHKLCESTLLALFQSFVLVDDLTEEMKIQRAKLFFELFPNFKKSLEDVQQNDNDVSISKKHD